MGQRVPGPLPHQPHLLTQTHSIEPRAPAAGGASYLVLQQHAVDEERSHVLLPPVKLQDRWAAVSPQPRPLRAGRGVRTHPVLQRLLDQREAFPARVKLLPVGSSEEQQVAEDLRSEQRGAASDKLRPQPPAGSDTHLDDHEERLGVVFRVLQHVTCKGAQA